ncbi:MAG: ribosome biogenesis GTPase Der [Candidatus Eisenbacteria bacterium]|nr:ribosome biogenesis GTPase Der [Candidatus Eisenbacteria bacterium]
MPNHPLPLVTLVGRPNVGKSTLFNRLVGGRRAVVSETAKTTRDRNYGEVEWSGHRFLLVDTGGLLTGKETEGIDHLVVRQVRAAVEEASVVVFLADAQTGVVAADLEAAREIRRLRKQPILALNKTESPKTLEETFVFLELGMGEPVLVSAAHGTGVGDLLDRIVAALPEDRGERIEEETIRIGIVGRPNVGKSSLVNAYLGQERMVVSEVPGTTRDSIDSVIQWRKRNLTLVDTAGLRRRSRVHEPIEYYAVLRSHRAIERSDVVFLLIDAGESIGAQDVRIASEADRLGKGIVVLLNKIDILDEGGSEARAREARTKMPFLSYAPVLTISALTRRRIGRALDQAIAVQKERTRVIPTPRLNRIVEEAIRRNPPPVGRGSNRIRYAVQTGTAPPCFLFFAKEPEAVTPAYRRYLMRSIRETVPFPGTPIVIRVRQKEDRR